MRSYITEAQDNDVVFLEMKKKITGVVNKRRIVARLVDIETFIETRKKPENISTQQNQVFNEIAYALDVEGSKPAVYLTYKRIAMFANNDSNVRLTIDEDILARTTDVSLRSKRYGEAILPEGYYLMEIKVNGAFPLWLAHILTDMNIYPTSFSKYGKFYEQEVKERISYE